MEEIKFSSKAGAIQYLADFTGNKIVVAKDQDWPEKVEKGGLRKKMGLKEDKPLKDQTTPEKVAKFFEDADEEERGMVTFAVNSNQDIPFWKQVGKLI